VLTHGVAEFALLETLRWTPAEGFFLAERHWARLRESARYFAIPLNLEAVMQVLQEKVEGLPQCPHGVRLLVSQEGQARAEARLLDAQRGPARVCPAEMPVDSASPFLYHKTTHRAVYENALAACPGYDDVLLWNQRGEVTESCIANLVVELRGERFTPPLGCGLLPGTYRAMLVQQGRAKERVIRMEELSACSKLWLVNSVRGEWEAALPVPACNGWSGRGAFSP